MPWVGNGTLAEIKERLVRLEDRQERQGKALDDLCAEKARRVARRDYWISKVIPALSGMIVAVLGLNAVLHWF